MICNIKYLLNMNYITYIHIMLICANVMLIYIVWAFKIFVWSKLLRWWALNLYIYNIYVYTYTHIYIYIYVVNIISWKYIAYVVHVIYAAYVIYVVYIVYVIYVVNNWHLHGWSRDSFLKVKNYNLFFGSIILTIYIFYMDSWRREAHSVFELTLLHMKLPAVLLIF